MNKQATQLVRNEARKVEERMKLPPTESGRPRGLKAAKRAWNKTSHIQRGKIRKQIDSQNKD